MKRARAAPASFFDSASDSDDSSVTARRRHRPNLPTFNTSSTKPTLQLQSSPATHHEDPEPDSLDQFMDSLKKPAHPTASSHSDDQADDSSDDGFVILREVPKDRLDNPNHESDEDPVDDALHPKGNSARDLVLPALDHSRISYPPLRPSGYTPVADLAALTEEQRMQRLKSLGAQLTGLRQNLVPVDRFEQLMYAVPSSLLDTVLGLYEHPTAIQSVAIPLALEGVDVIGVAKTGSGKTAAYTIPMLAHVERQKKGTSAGGKGPSGLVVAPTRELAAQIGGVVERLAEGMGMRVMCVIGGVGKYEQFKRLRDGGAEVVVCTPGRLIDMLKMKACGLGRCSFVVLDEADRMLDMGFGAQVDAILGQIRPDAQKLMFSATFPKPVEKLAGVYLRQYARITIGRGGGVNRLENGETFEVGESGRSGVTPSIPMVSENVHEIYELFPDEARKEAWLLENLEGLVREGLVIVFCPSRGASAALANVIRTTGRPAACVHGETDPADREGLLQMFRSGELPLLITTDLTARGLDIANIKNVVNYGCAKSWEWHVHRVGRTGRADEQGNAYTLVCENVRADMTFVSQAIAAYRKWRCEIPRALKEMEERNRSGSFSSGGRQRGRGARGGRWRRPHR
eukprot:GFKZ01005981.1.p1 GENE.GFKZ01005981.1~~GFKZ01005981.1.p1  ORF type:complete len:629 (-),score=82.39 GFKZ01005981.1:1571-3457(-)